MVRKSDVTKGVEEMNNKKRSIPYFSVRVKKRLVELDMTQRQLAEEVGMSEKYLTEVLRGRRSGARYREAILETLGIEQFEREVI